jgi:hypothetical protein
MPWEQRVRAAGEYNVQYVTLACTQLVAGILPALEVVRGDGKK